MKKAELREIITHLQNLYPTDRLLRTHTIFALEVLCVDHQAPETTIGKVMLIMHGPK